MISKSWKENNLLPKFELSDENDILLEKIYGNVAIVYHRGNKYKIDHLLKGTYKNKSHIDFNYYNKALYTTFDLESQLNTNSHQRNDMRRTYGDYIIKLAVKGISNFWFCDYDIYKKFHPNTTPETWKEEQFKKFNINKELSKKFGNDPSFNFDHVTVSKIFEEYRVLGKRVKGIVYYGKHDGNCALIYDWKTAIPISISEDEGKSWKKISKEENSELRQNFNKNDYIDTNKKMTKPLYKIDMFGNVAITNKEITSLEGVPDIVEGSFDCSGCKKLISLAKGPTTVIRSFVCSGCENLTSLEGAPDTVGESFHCNNCNNLTSLAGAPDTVKGDFNCSGCENLTSLKGAPTKVKRDFICSNCKNLTSLEGVPDTVKGDFDCSGCESLKSLVKGPTTVGGNFSCRDCRNLTSLEGAPTTVEGSFECSGCENLTSLAGAPTTVEEDFRCLQCKKLTSLEGAPTTVMGYFICSNCENLTSLAGTPNTVGGNFSCYKCKNLTSLEGAPTTVGGNFSCRDCRNLTSLDGFNTKIGGGFYADYELEQLYDQKYKESKYLDFFKYYELKK